MIIKAEQKYIRVSPRKLRLVADSISRLPPREALEQLSFMRKKAAVPVSKTIKQALANATKNLNLQEESLRFESIQVNEGPTFKRWRAVSRGRAHPILKRTSHIKVLLTSIEEPKETDKSQTRQSAKKERKIGKEKLEK